MMHLIQIEWIRSLQESFPLILKTFLTMCNALDSLTFYSVIILTVWMGIDRKKGIELLYLTLISSAVTMIVKQFYDMPRPLQVDPSIALVAPPGSGFPSGAAQMAFLWSAYFYDQIRGKAALIFALFYLFFMSFVRVFIGAHFVTDILMGWFVGGSLFALYRIFHDSIYKNFKKKKPLMRALLICLISFWTIFIFCKEEVFRIGIATSAFAIGLYLDAIYNDKLKAPKALLEGSLRVFAALAQFALILIAMWLATKYLDFPKKWSVLVAFILLGIWIPYGATKVSLKIQSLMR